MTLSILPFIVDLVDHFVRCSIPINIRIDYCFMTLWILLNMNLLLIIVNEVVVKSQPSRLFLYNHDFSNIHEELVNLRIFVVKINCSVNSPATFVSL